MLSLCNPLLLLSLDRHGTKKDTVVFYITRKYKFLRYILYWEIIPLHLLARLASLTKEQTFIETVPRDFRLQVFFVNQFPQAPEYPIKAVWIFSKILGYILNSRCTTGVVDSSGVPWLANISANFRKSSKWLWCYFRGLGGKWFMKKLEAKNLDQKYTRCNTEAKNRRELALISVLPSLAGKKGRGGHDLYSEESMEKGISSFRMLKSMPAAWYMLQYLYSSHRHHRNHYSRAHISPSGYQLKYSPAEVRRS